MHLTVVHRLRDEAGHGLAESHAGLLRSQGFFLDTCLRQLCVLANIRFDEQPAAGGLKTDAQLEWFRGDAAYSFLLQTITGLNSRVPGETNIDGQFRRAWNEWQGSGGAYFWQLQETMQRLFADSAAIRRQYLHGIGGSSYGSLVRKLLKPRSDARVLFVGAGELAQSMLPFFTGFDLALWNHRPVTWAPADLRLFAEEQSPFAANWATHVILTTPAESANENLWVGLTEATDKCIMHLGRRSAEPGIWSHRRDDDRYFDLDDVFALRSRQNSVRSLQIHRARRACAELARNRVGTPPTDMLQPLLA